LQADRRWTPATADEFFAGDDPSVPTTVFIHGNLVEPSDAIHDGWSVYNDLLCRAAGRPFRLVIWSWPSQRMIRNLRDDAQLKACYSDTQAYYLACWLDRAARDAPVNLVGFSFGARVATGALHLAAGGEVAGRRLGADRAERLKPIRAVLVAAALDADWLLPGHHNGLALSQVERMLVTVNPLDPVLRRYPLMYRRGGPEALGCVGPLCSGQLGDEREKIETFNASCSVGHAHAWARYNASPSLRGMIARYAFFAEPPSTASAVQDSEGQDATVQDAAGPSLP
jgi:pimeloyl-ACP methyl ester carboxylesterase